MDNGKEAVSSRKEVCSVGARDQTTTMGKGINETRMVKMSGRMMQSGKELAILRSCCPLLTCKTVQCTQVKRANVQYGGLKFSDTLQFDFWRAMDPSGRCEGDQNHK